MNRTERRKSADRKYAQKNKEKRKLYRNSRRDEVYVIRCKACRWSSRRYTIDTMAPCRKCGARDFAIWKPVSTGRKKTVYTDEKVRAAAKLEQGRKSGRKYAEKNKEKLRAQSKRWESQNRKHRNEYRRDRKIDLLVRNGIESMSDGWNGSTSGYGQCRRCEEWVRPLVNWYCRPCHKAMYAEQARSCINCGQWFFTEWAFGFPEPSAGRKALNDWKRLQYTEFVCSIECAKRKAKTSPLEVLRSKSLWKVSVGGMLWNFCRFCYEPILSHNGSSHGTVIRCQDRKCMKRAADLVKPLRKFTPAKVIGGARKRLGRRKDAGS